jgi:hypothetical protein
MAEPTKADLAGALDDRVRKLETDFAEARGAGRMAKGAIALSASAFLACIGTGVWSIAELRANHTLVAERLKDLREQLAADNTRHEKAIDRLEVRLNQLRGDGRQPVAFTNRVSDLVFVVEGSIQRVEGRTVSVALRGVGRWECEIGAKTVCRVNGKVANLGALKAGMDGWFVLADKADREPLLVEATTPPPRVVFPSVRTDPPPG